MSGGKGELPNCWAVCKLPEIVYFQEGPGLRKYQYREAGIPFLNIRTLVNERVDRSLCKFLDKSEVEKKYKHFLLDPGDLVCSTSGTLGKIATIREEDLPLLLNTSVVRFRSLNEGVILQRFVRLYLKSDLFLRQAFAASTGSAQINVGPSHLKTFDLNLPPLAEQKRIADKLEAVLGRVDACRARLDRVPALLKRFRQSVLAAAVSGKLTEEWRETNKNVPSAEILVKKQKFSITETDENLTSLPPRWMWVALGDYAQCSRGRFSPRPRNDPRYFNGEHAFIQIGDLPREGGSVSTHTQTLNNEGLAVSKKFPKGTVVIAIVGATIGNTGILAYDMCATDSIVGLETGVSFGNKYIELFLRSRKEAIRQISYASGGQPNINLATLNPYPLPLPPLPEQQEIVRRVEDMFAFADRIEARLATAQKTVERLTPATLAKAFRGELVPQDPNDEPASTLLERLRSTEPVPSSKKTRR